MKECSKNLCKDQSGQSLVEFILLFSIVVGISFAFMSSINGIIGERWTQYANILLKDTDEQTKLELR